MTGRRGFALVVTVLLAAVVTVSLLSTSRSPDASPQQRAHRLDQQLRCPVCDGQSVADSPS